MPLIVDNRDKDVDPTIKIFDDFYSFQTKVNAAEFDIVYGYFRNVCKTGDIANNFTTALFRVSQQTGTNVITLLQELQGTTSTLKMNEIMAFYLNAFRSKISLYGIGAVAKPNESVARNVVQ